MVQVRKYSRSSGFLQSTVHIYLVILGCWACCRQGRGESYPDCYPGKLQIVKLSRFSPNVGLKMRLDTRVIVSLFVFHYYLSLQPSLLRGLKKTNVLWIDLEEKGLRNSKIFFDGVFLYLYTHLIKKLEIFKLRRKKVMRL